jgi:predicted chitinase
MKLFTGVVENRNDPLRLGRCQVRVVGLHTHDKTALPTEDLPWAVPMQPVTSAAMNGIGWTPLGPVEGTWVVVVFTNEDNQQPIMMGTLGGIPQKDGVSVDADDDGIILKDEGSETTPTQNSNVVTTGSGAVLTDGSGNPVTTGTAATPTAIPGPGPYESKGGVKIPANATKGIQAIASAMDSAGITSKYARAAILGIAGGESMWVPQNEAYTYSITRIKQVYSWIDEANAETYSNWKGSRDEFFRYIYGPTTRSGKSLGHTEVDDGAKYWGRGFIQLTGKGNYKRYAKLSNVDIINSPELCNDYTEGAKICVAYFKDRVKVDQTDPSYFEAACVAVGYNTPDIKAKKKAFYEYFLGSESSEKDSTPGAVPNNVEVNASGIPKDREQNLVIGFRDPEMKYPLRTHIGEPDTNRLARGTTKGTNVEKRDATRAVGLPMADGSKFSQPAVPYNSKYPFNHVYESESGHVQEFDDTPKNERIHWYHKSGSFLETDVNGTHVNRIVGDGYEIIDKNGYVYVRGALTLTAEGVTNIYVSADANIKVEGITNIDLLNDVNLNVAGDFNINVAGSYNVKAADITIESTTDSIDITTPKDFNITADVNVNIKAAEGLFAESGADMNILAGAGLNQEASGEMNILSGGNMNLDYAQGHFGEGASGAEASTDAATTNLGDPPEIGNPTNNSFAAMETPTRDFEGEIDFETPDEVDSPAGKEFHNNREIVGTPSTAQNTTPSEETPAAGNKVQAAGANCDLIYTSTSFPMAFKLSERVSIGDLIKDSKHILADLTSNGKTVTKQEIVCNMKGLADNCIEKVFDAAGGKGAITITSGFRSPGVTAGASSTSQHNSGQAFDFVLTGKVNDYKAHFDFIQKIDKLIPYDQLILEYRDPGVNGNNKSQRICWIHCSFSYKNLRKSGFTMLNDKTYKRDASGNPSGFFLV